MDPTQTIAALKLFLWVEVFALQQVSIPGSHLDYVFRAEEDDYFSDEKLRLCDTPYYIECLKDETLFVSVGHPTTPITLFLVSAQEIAKANELIESMIGYKLCRSDEGKAFRKEMHSVANRVMRLCYRRMRVPQLSIFENVDGYLPPQFNLHVWFWHETSIETHQQCTSHAKLHDTANEILQRILNDHPYQFQGYSEVATEYVLKIRGLDDWVWDVIELICLETVRNCLRKRRKVEVVVYPKDAVPSHMAQVLLRYGGFSRSASPSSSVSSASTSMSSKSSSLLRMRPENSARGSVAIGFDMSTVFKTEEHVPPTWYKSWDLTDKRLTVKIRSMDHIAFDAALFKLPKKRDALTHIFIATTLVTPACVPSGSQTHYSPIGQTARTPAELYLEESLEPITCRADLFLPYFSQIPRASKLRLEVVVRYKEIETVVAWYEQPVFDFASIVRTGFFNVNCVLGNSTTCYSPWISNAVQRSTPGNAPVGSSGPRDFLELSLLTGGPSLSFEIESLDEPVVYPFIFSGYENHPSLSSLDPSESNPSAQSFSTMHTALATLLHRPTRQEQVIFWKHRPWCQKNAKSLDLFLASIPWTKPGALQLSYQLLDRWAVLDHPLEAIRLLNKNHLEPKFREHAVRTLHQLSDSELAEVLLQLVQSLKHELTHDSALARFLLVRALFNQNQIGHYFYWHLKACLQSAAYRDRYSLLLEVYLRYCSSFRQELHTQTLIYNRLITIATELKTIRDPTKRIPFLHAQLNQMATLGLPNPLGSTHPPIPMPPTFQLPISCNMIGKQFNVAKCKNLESKTLPLWIVADSADPLGDPVYGIMKVGDDLRQDQLTLQMFALMDKLWLANGLDLKMSAYRVIETGMECGMIEVVPNAQTNAQIQKQYGGVTAAFSDKPLSEWLQKNNPNEHDHAAAVRDFASSCAGYCVATYVLGIGDRHNDNIMITKSGHLFHIDFGRFLGNSEKFAGVSRDRAPFVFTPEFAYVMGGTGSQIYQKFVQQACAAYNIVRRHASLFTTLLAMMLQTGIPELRSEDDITYLCDAFSLELTEEEAARKFETLISKSLETTATQLNFAIHIWANPEK